ncbi:hypothetical protein Catovirus_1_726 [Catovirus CTV1]|uniref:Uncharacterized protein n=1 Tax=Catovirus CTV1 TaxID=1977631 RepID=A0A1V0SAE1_9VIRU|nr:hypothetical protein Catovirus_1_726 [Catovirus CTV1]
MNFCGRQLRIVMALLAFFIGSIAIICYFANNIYNRTQSPIILLIFGIFFCSGGLIILVCEILRYIYITLTKMLNQFTSRDEETMLIVNSV